MSRFSLGLEMIGFQDSTTFNTLSEYFDTLIKSRYKDEKTLLAIEKLLKDRFGLTIATLIDDNYGTCVWLPTFNQNHIFYTNEIKKYLHEYSREELKKIKKLKEFNELNTIDIRNGKVSGLFTEIKTEININQYQLAGMTGQEVAAVYLHEVGHIFTYYENMTKVTTTNHVLLDLCTMAEKQETIEQKKIYLKDADELGLTKRGDLDDIVEMDNSVGIATVYLTKISKYNSSTTDSYLYDDVTCEQLADQFVSRLGGGRHLVTALNKIETRYSQPLSKTAQFLGDIFMTSFQIIMTIASVILAPGLGIFMSILLVLVFLGSGSANKDYTYDNVKVRFQRIRNDLMLRLKNDKAKKESMVLIKEIEACDRIISGYEEYKTIFTRVMDFISKPSSELSKKYELQRDLETLASNDLFLKAYKLSSI